MIKKTLNSQINTAQTHVALLILRVSFGAMMLTHGYGKFMRVLDGNLKFGDPIGLGPEVSLILAVIGEFVAAITLMLGLATRVSAFLLTFTMGVAAFVAHDGDPFGKKEKALMYFVVFGILMIVGGGKYSLDRKLD